MTDKEKIKQEIERRIEQCYRLLAQDLLERERNETNCCLQQYKELLQFINSLTEEPASEDWEEEIENFLKDPVFGKLINRNAGLVLARHFAEWGRNHIEDKSEMISEDLEEATSKYVREDFHERSRADFKAGAEWQRKKDQQTIELAEDHAMLAGMNKMKEEILSKAFSEATLIDWYISSIDETIPPIWTEAHINELYKDFYLIPKEALQ